MRMREAAGLTNGSAEDTVFTPAPFPVQGDCLGELGNFIEII